MGAEQLCGKAVHLLELALSTGNLSSLPPVTTRGHFCLGDPPAPPLGLSPEKALVALSTGERESELAKHRPGRRSHAFGSLSLAGRHTVHDAAASWNLETRLCRPRPPVTPQDARPLGRH